MDLSSILSRGLAMDGVYGWLHGSQKSIPKYNDELIETEDVSFFGMVWWLLWKNFKSQCQRRKKC